MSLPTTNVTISAIKTETGLTSNNVSGLVGASGLNKFSFYAPGSLSVDVNKNTVLTPPSSGYKQGDFRQYNHTTAPSVFSIDHDWGPGGTTFDVVHPWTPNQMNIWEYAIPGDYVTIKYYLSDSDRLAEINLLKTSDEALTFGTITPLTGHTRSTTKRIVSTQLPEVLGVPTGTLTKPNDIIYAEHYISDLANNRKINIGATRSSGFSTVLTHERSLPFISRIDNIIPVPSGYTAIFPDLHTSSFPVCSNTAEITQTFGGSTFNFYIKARGIFSTEDRIVAVQDCSVMLTINSVSQKIYQGSLSHHTGTLCSGSLTVGGGTWSYDEIGYISIVNASFATTPLFTVCP